MSIPDPLAYAGLAMATALAGWVVVLLRQRAAAETRAEALRLELARAAGESSSQIESGELRLRELSRVVPVGLVELDLTGLVLHMSERGRRICGLSRTQARGHNWLSAVHPADRDAVRDLITDSAHARKPFDATFRVVVGDEERIVDLQGILQHDADERPIGFVASINDVTERENAAEARRVLEERVRQTQKVESLGILAGGIAHDFNNLLVGILCNAGIALETLPAGDARVAVQQIETASLRAAALTDQMLAYSGQGQFIVEPIDLTQLVRDSAHLLDIATSRGAVLEYELVEDIPATEADATQIRQVLMNLVGNAAEAYAEAGGRVVIATGSAELGLDELRSAYLDEDAPAGLYVYLEVRDEGQGMDGETKDRLFDPFFTTKFTGRGLGLAATLGIIRGHHGSIQVESEPERGSRFRVLLPATERAASGVATTPKVAAVPARSASVLIVDDEEMVRDTTSRTLRARGFNTVCASSGPQAIEVYRDRSEDIDVILLDMVMPGMNGHQVLEKLRIIRPDARVVLTSGYSEMYAKDGLADGAIAAFIQKPYRPSQLGKVLADVLDGPSTDHHSSATA